MINAFVRIRSWLIACTALVLYELARWGLSFWIYPTFHSVFPLAREIGTASEVFACFALLAIVMNYSRGALVLRVSHCLTPLLVVASLGMMCVAISMGSVTLLVIGAVAYGLAAPWFYIAASAVLIELSPEKALLAVGTAAVLRCLISVATEFVLADAATGYLVQGIICLACLGVSWNAARSIPSMLDNEAPGVAPLFVNPRSYIPAGHPLFTSVVLLGAVRGIALTYGSIASVPVQMPLNIFPLVLIIGLSLLALRRSRALDTLYLGVIVLVLAGLTLFCPTLLSAPRSPFVQQIPNVLFSSGADCLVALALLVSSAIGRRNPADFFRIAALYEGSICLGILGGATVGHGLNLLLPRHLEAVAWGFSLAAVVFACYNFLLLRSFSFDDVVSHVRPVDTPRIVPPSESFDERCRSIAESFALTPREAEILQFYARGRSTAVVQEELVLSYNTLKTHELNLYRKTDVHSQQELIDLVDSWPCQGE